MSDRATAVADRFLFLDISCTTFSLSAFSTPRDLVLALVTPSIETVFNRCVSIAGTIEETVDKCTGRPMEPDALIGFFQSLRPHGSGLDTVFDGFSCSADLIDRLSGVYAAAGTGSRDAIMRDAYFVVRQPEVIDHLEVQRIADEWVENMEWLSKSVGGVDSFPATRPSVRVLEGTPPKQPKRDEDKTNLMLTFQKLIPSLIEKADPDNELAAFLRPAYYFINCDTMLRDYLMWPLHSEVVCAGRFGDTAFDPFTPYFQLWKHGIKFRIYRDDQIDIYMPRHFEDDSPALLD